MCKIIWKLLQFVLPLHRESYTNCYTFSLLVLQRYTKIDTLLQQKVKNFLVVRKLEETN